MADQRTHQDKMLGVIFLSTDRVALKEKAGNGQTFSVNTRAKTGRVMRVGVFAGRKCARGKSKSTARGLGSVASAVCAFSVRQALQDLRLVRSTALVPTTPR